MKHIIFGISLLFLAACGGQSNPENPAADATTPTTEQVTVTLTPEQLRNAQLEIGQPQMRPLGSSIKVNGFVEAPPQNLVSISAPMGGYLKQTKLLPGMRIRKGEVLAVLEDQQYINLQQEYLSTKTRLEYLSADLTRQETLNRDQSASEKALQQARMEYQTQQINAKALSEKLALVGINADKLTPERISKQVSLYSPIDGFVSTVKVNIGKYAAPTDVLFELVNTSDIHLTLKAFEKDLPSLRIGQKVTAFANADPDKRYTAKVFLIGQNVDEDRSVDVHCHFEQAAHGLLPGMFMSAEVETNGRTTLSLPDGAIVRYENKHYVFVQTAEGTFDMVEIMQGVTENGFTELLSPTDQQLLGKSLVVKNAYTLLMKAKNTAE